MSICDLLFHWKYDKGPFTSDGICVMPCVSGGRLYVMPFPVSKTAMMRENQIPHTLRHAIGASQTPLSRDFGLTRLGSLLSNYG